MAGKTLTPQVKKTGGKQFNDGKPGPGRPKGVPNKITTAAKDAIADAAEKLGGVNRLVAWAKEDDKNESAFWTSIYPKLLPLHVNGSHTLTLTGEAAKWLGRT